MKQFYIALILLVLYLIGFIEQTFFNVWNTVYRIVKLQNPHFVYAIHIKIDKDILTITKYSFCFTKHGIMKFINIINLPIV